METRVKPTWLNIPAEIRCKVYHLLLNAKQPITRNSYRHTRNGERINTTILRTCKLMYREALPILNDNVFLIEVRKFLVPWAAPQIVAAVPLMSNGSRLRIDPLLSNFIVDIKIEENFQVRYPSWPDPIEAVADALTMVERVKTLQINVTYQTIIRSVGDGIVAGQVPPMVAEMVVDCFPRLRGVVHADVTGLGDDESSRALIRSLQRPAQEQGDKEREDEEEREDGEDQEDDEEEDDEEEDEIEHRPAKRIRLA